MRLSTIPKRHLAESTRAVPGWLEPALQGITFWIGHRRSMYRHYPLTKGAIVAELCNLIQAQLRDGQRLDCEAPYTEILGLQSAKGSSSNQRADLVVSAGATSHNYVAVIEVRRSDAGNADMDEAIRRLASVKVARAETRALLIVVSEGQRPSRFVGEAGPAIRKQENGIRYAVRRVCVASASVERGDRANYAVLVEVL